MGERGEPNGMPRDLNAPSATGREVSHDEQSLQSEDGFIAPERLEKEAHEHDKSSQIAKSWLLSFSDHKSETQPASRFKIEESDYPEHPPHSMLPMLTSWIRVWFKRSLIESQDRINLSWLLQYTANYVSLGHCMLDHDEVYQLCLSLLHVCKNARQHSHIEGSLAVFLSIAEVGHFPSECLKDVLSTLSSATVILEKPLPRIGACVKILASGSLGRETVRCLYELLLIVPETLFNKESQPGIDTMKCLTPARGAARHLRSSLELKGSDEKFVVDIKQLLDALRDTAEARIQRLATEILDLLTRLLYSARSTEVSSDQSLSAALLDIFGTCKHSTLVPDAADNSLTKIKFPKDEQQKRERRYKHDHESSILRFQEALGTVLLHMVPEVGDRAWTEIKHTIGALPTNLRAGPLQYVLNRERCMPGAGDQWDEDLMLLIEEVVISKTDHGNKETEFDLLRAQPSSELSITKQIDERIQQRIDVLHLCIRSIRAIAQSGAGNTEFSTSPTVATQIGDTALAKLMPLFVSEQNHQIIQAFLREMTNLSDTASDTSLQPYAHSIVENLQNKIVKDTLKDDISEDLRVAGTETIQAILLQNLASSSPIANQAFQALIKIADCQECTFSRARLAAMRMLFRIRCDSSGVVYIDTDSDSAYIASALCRTEQSLNDTVTEIEAVRGLTPDETRDRICEMSRAQLWSYPDEDLVTASWTNPNSSGTHIQGFHDSACENYLDISDWLYRISANLQFDKDWETYSYMIVHLGSQLVNTILFERSHESIAMLRGHLCDRVRDPPRMFEPPPDMGLRKADVAICFYHILKRLIPYNRMQIPHMPESGRRGIDLVRAFRAGINRTYEGTARMCIHALSICCFETPDAIGAEYPAIVFEMSQTFGRPHLTVHILEFLAQVARLPHLHKHFMEAEITKITGICCSAVKALRQKEDDGKTTHSDSKNSDPRKAGVTMTMQTAFRRSMSEDIGISQYSCALAYHTMIFWFLSIPLGLRHQQITNVLNQLTFEDTAGNTTVDEQTIVMIDMMQRSAYSDLPETARDESFTGDDYKTTSYMDGNSVVTIETHKTTGRSQITKRQAAGTTYAVYEPRVQSLPIHHDRVFFDQLALRGLHDQVTPSHTFLNMTGSAVPIPLSEQPLKLNPNEAYVSRGLSAIDRMPPVDSHRIAVTLLKTGQREEAEYLANITGTHDFETFLDSLGTRVSLQRPTPFVHFNLEYGTDGTETVAWRDRINEIVYEISTLMPNVEGDMVHRAKKSHLGNCMVLIVFNQSNEPWRSSYFSSQVTLVHIIITPANRVSGQELSDEFEHEYYQVEVLTNEDGQNVSAAAETKVVSKATLAPFVRILALNATIFSECSWNQAKGDAEFPSSWRYRLQQIKQLRERTQQRYPDNEDVLSKQYNFARWT